MLNNFEGEPMSIQPQQDNIDSKSEKTQTRFEHIPVLPREVIKYVDPKPNGTYIDCTLGGGGHTILIAEKLEENGKIIGIDQDPEAIKAAQERLSQYRDKIIYVRDNFRNLESILKKLEVDSVDGILIDLGVSTHQLETPERGFSFSETDKAFDQPLDMRMNPESETSAYDVINSYPEKDLREIFFEYGEEPKSAQIAHRIVQERQRHPIETTNQLLGIIRSSTSPKYRYSRQYGHYASKIFRAVCIEVNEELTVLREVIPQAVENLNHGGRLVIISFYSGEDRIVKHAFRQLITTESQEPYSMVTPGVKKPEEERIRLLTKKPIRAQEDELKTNPKSESARLRAIEMI